MSRLALCHVLTVSCQDLGALRRSAEQVSTAVQAVSEDECGLAAMSTDEALQQLLAQLMDGQFRLLVRGRAAVLLASLKSGSVDLFAEVSPFQCSLTLCMLRIEDVAGVQTVMRWCKASMQDNTQGLPGLAIRLSPLTCAG